MLTIGNYIDAALRQAHYEIIGDEEPCYGSVPGLQGVWASGKTRARERFGFVRATPFEKGLRRTIDYTTARFLKLNRAHQRRYRRIRSCRALASQLDSQNNLVAWRHVLQNAHMPCSQFQPSPLPVLYSAPCQL